MRRALLPLVLAAVVAGCGGDGAETALSETADRLGEIRSGVLDFSIVVTPVDGEEFGFELTGPFDLRNEMPVMRIDYTQIANGERGTVTLVSTGDEAWAEANGERIELTAEQVEELRLVGRSVGGAEGLESLAIDDWIEDPDLADGEEVGGDATDRVTAELDIVAAVNGLNELVRSFGRDLPRIEGRSADRLREATRSTSFELLTGKDDRLLRRLAIEADFGLDVPQELRDALGEVVGGRVRFLLAVAKPNEPVNPGG